MADLTADFSEFRAKVEPIFGRLEVLAEQAPDVYAHQVLSHGFMEYAIVNRLHDEAKSATGKGMDAKEFWEHLKPKYLAWARENNLPEKLLESGWSEYIND